MNSNNTQDYLILEKAKELQLFLLDQKIILWGAHDQYNTFESKPEYEFKNTFWKMVFPVFYVECKKILDSGIGDSDVKIGFINHLTEQIKTHALQDAGLQKERYGSQVGLISRLIKTYSKDILDLFDSPLFQKIYLNKEISTPLDDKNDNKVKGKI